VYPGVERRIVDRVEYWVRGVGFDLVCLQVVWLFPPFHVDRYTRQSDRE